MRLVEVLVYLICGLLAIPAAAAGIVGAATFDPHGTMMQ